MRFRDRWDIFLMRFGLVRLARYNHLVGQYSRANHELARAVHRVQLREKMLVSVLIGPFEDALASHKTASEVEKVRRGIDPEISHRIHQERLRQGRNDLADSCQAIFPHVKPDFGI